MTGQSYMTQQEVAILLGISKQAVCEYEKRALRKLRQHPIMIRLAVEYGWQEDTEEPMGSADL